MVVSSDPYRIARPTGARVPILLSVPHCGVAFPEEVREEFQPGLINAPDDTDWFVDRLYGFASSMGITMISAVYSRWVIDLNRHPEGKPLYSDGRIVTALCPVTTFLNTPLYSDSRGEVSAAEVARRRTLYFEPYHRKLTELLDDLRSEFGKVLLWDCHSIRQIVPTIRPDRFPDLILGSADGTSAKSALTETALFVLQGGPYQASHNHPFKGGYITRHYGDPASGVNALQLEMTKINYMDDEEKCYHPVRAKKMGELLNNTLSALAESLISTKD